MARDSALQALGYPTRRWVLERLKSGPMSVGRLAQGMKEFSRPAISQHLKVLKEAGLVREHREGRKRVYEIDRKGFDAVQRWLDQF